jgi:phosphoglycolate phosphatase
LTLAPAQSVVSWALAPEGLSLPLFAIHTPAGSTHSAYYNKTSMTSPIVRPVEAFIFDLDGTLIDSKLDLVDSVNAMLRQIGRVELPADTVASYIGHGAPRLVASALGCAATEAERKNALALFLDHYGKHNLDETRPYPGVIEALQALANLPLAVLTNKPLKMSVQILEGLDLLRYFRGVYGGDSFEKKKPNPDGAISILRELRSTSAKSAMVGDSDVDIQTARNAGMIAIAVNYGFGQQDPQANPADAYVDSLVELIAMTARRKVS